MDPKDFEKVKISKGGNHYLVSEPDLKRLTQKQPVSKESNWVFDVFEVPELEQLKIGFLVKHHREAQRIKVRQLARLIKKDHKHILKIESGEIAVPEIETLKLLARELGPKFRKGLQLLGFLI